jgi:mRNA-degrading endonuclease toxin of MazEF toxin-antitoxin module
MNLPRGSLVLVDLEPTRGHEQRGTRPCLVVSDPAVNSSQPIRRCYGQVSEAELASIDAGLRLYLGLEPDPD